MRILFSSEYLPRKRFPVLVVEILLDLPKQVEENALSALRIPDVFILSLYHTRHKHRSHRILRVHHDPRDLAGIPRNPKLCVVRNRDLSCRFVHGGVYRETPCAL